MKRTADSSQVAKRPKSKATSKAKIYKPVSFSKAGLPNVLKNTLRYAEYVQMTTSSVGKASYLFSCNGLYDPNITGTGHQPHYYDQIQALYNHYQVTASRLKVTPYGPGDSGAWALCIFIDDDATVGLSNQYDEYEREGAVTTVFQANYQAPRTMYYKWSNSAFGKNKDNDKMIGNAGANPTEQQYYVLALQGPVSVSMYFLVELEYDVTWTELKTVAGS